MNAMEEALKDGKEGRAMMKELDWPYGLAQGHFIVANPAALFTQKGLE
jgi:hypothetical protein